MRFIHSFNAFLKDHVNLNQTRVDQADDAFDTLTSFLENAEDLEDVFIDTSKQGSLRQGTIIKPRTDETEFDVDLLLRLNDVADWSPTDYLDAVKAAFEGSARYEDLVDTRGKHRCITIDYANEFHVDVVPSIERDGQCWIMNRDTDEFEVTDGDGYAEWFTDRNEIAGGQLIRVVRLVKYLRDEHEWPVKSILLTTLLGDQVSDADPAEDYEDLPTALVRLLTRLDEYLQEQAGVPDVVNPALPEEAFTRHWDEETFEQFRDGIHEVAQLVSEAYAADDGETSGDKWKEAFGDAFPVADEDLEDGEELAEALLNLGPTAHAQPVTAIPVNSEVLRYTVRVDAKVYSQGGKKFFRGINSDARIASNRTIHFKARTNAPEPYDVRWQVVNTGRHAERENGLRGNFFGGRDLQSRPMHKLQNWETTQYTGRHWIECFIVKDGVCVGRSGRFYINIKNPSF